MDFEEQVDFQISSAEWCSVEARKVIAEYKACKTEDARVRLLPKMKQLLGRLAFEKREIEKYMDL